MKLISEQTPVVPMKAMDTLWFQVSGTVCNIKCEHCFISCSPTNTNHELMTREQVKKYLDESVSLGVKEYYFTGGEPFLNKDIWGILEDTLALGPATVLTNGMLIQDSWAKRLAGLRDASEYSLDIRISLDSFEEAGNDKIRGDGVFRKAVEGMKNLAKYGFIPIITAVAVWQPEEDEKVRREFVSLLASIGIKRPRLKVMPVLHLGAEVARTSGYAADQFLTTEHFNAALGYSPELLQCSSCRMVTSKGVYVCPILIEEAGAKMGETISETLRPFPLAYQACHTCLMDGLSCKT
jgi:molybdenum cofactor biosynthesis enzyme MoaA